MPGQAIVTALLLLSLSCRVKTWIAQTSCRSANDDDRDALSAKVPGANRFPLPWATAPKRFSIDAQAVATSGEEHLVRDQKRSAPQSDRMLPAKSAEALRISDARYFEGRSMPPRIYSYRRAFATDVQCRAVLRLK